MLNLVLIFSTTVVKDYVKFNLALYLVPPGMVVVHSFSSWVVKEFTMKYSKRKKKVKEKGRERKRKRKITIVSIFVFLELVFIWIRRVTLLGQIELLSNGSVLHRVLQNTKSEL